MELLIDLRDALAAQLDEQGKRQWAEGEFAAIAASAPAAPRAEPWRRTSGLHRVRRRHQLAIVRALWQARDEIARRRDISPGRVLPDAAIVAAALAAPATQNDLLNVSVFNGRALRRQVGTWFAAIESARALPEADWPDLKALMEVPPPARSWAERDPAAAARLAAARTAVAEIAEHHRLPMENLLSPDSLRRLAWSPPVDLSAEAVAAALRGYGARRWQVELAAASVASALARAATVPTAVTSDEDVPI